MYKANAMIAPSSANPPITPPAIAPTFTDVEAGVDDGEGVCDGEGVGDGGGIGLVIEFVLALVAVGKVSAFVGTKILERLIQF